jgi:hypothetical protein
MILRGIDFGPVTGASGVQGWFGEGYRFHKWMGPLRPRFEGSCFVAKTTTLLARRGNMELKRDKSFAPVRLFPKCVKAYFWKGMAVNSVGLSGPGAVALLNTDCWQAREEPFLLSFMSVEKLPEDRLEELSRFVSILKLEQTRFKTKFGLQINFSCPNVGLDPSALTAEIETALDITASLSIPIIPKLNTMVPPAAAVKIGSHHACDAICISNTLPWNTVFPDRRSPLDHLGGGGVSGKPLFPLVLDWVKRFRALGCELPLNVGGGILGTYEVDQLAQNGVDLSSRRDSIALGTIAMLRPWRVAPVIQFAHWIATKAI